ncbi:unnamed protein product [Rotaria sordida]|uniref:B box-type domain-containing protein n=1 Tax=Rotaria sordida TaxID=392033 RepID=A0A819MIT1_9BILA|nr:unnamed protein product [Rotaria sordida]CAF3979786.1 unnamed protein product [Rotaria sordida]
MLRRGLNKFDASLLSNDGGKYSPSIRKLRQHYLHDTKCLTDKIFLSPIQSSSVTKQFSKQTSDPQLSSSHHHYQSSIDLMATSVKCDHCQKHEGLFQCCHCNQRLCIRCCNKHYKKVTTEFEHLHELSHCLLMKIIHKKRDLEKQKDETIEQCHKWRIDTINIINEAHKLLIQTIYDEYEILNKEYELFIDKEMSNINSDKHELIRMKKGNLSSLLLSPSSKITTKNSIKSIDIIKKRIETLTKHINEIENFSFQVKLPTFDINDNLIIESHFGDHIRSTNTTLQNEDYINNTSSIKSKEISKKEFSTDSQSINLSSQKCDTNDSYPSIKKTIIFPSDHYKIYSSISTNQLNTCNHNHQNTHKFHRTLSSSLPSIDNTNRNVQIKYESDNSLENIAIEQLIPTCDAQRTTTTVPIRSSSLLNTNKVFKNYPSLYYRTNSTPSFIQ